MRNATKVDSRKPGSCRHHDRLVPKVTFYAYSRPSYSAEGTQTWKSKLQDCRIRHDLEHRGRLIVYTRIVKRTEESHGEDGFLARKWEAHFMRYILGGSINARP